MVGLAVCKGKIVNAYTHFCQNVLKGDDCLEDLNWIAV